MPKHITDPETWSVWSGDIEWDGKKGEGGKADFRPFVLFNGKRWGIINPMTKWPQPPPEPRPPTNIGACPVDQIEEIIFSSELSSVIRMKKMMTFTFTFYFTKII